MNSHTYFALTQWITAGAAWRPKSFNLLSTHLGFAQVSLLWYLYIGDIALHSPRKHVTTNAIGIIWLTASSGVESGGSTISMLLWFWTIFCIVASLAAVEACAFAFAFYGVGIGCHGLLAAVSTTTFVAKV